MLEKHKSAKFKIMPFSEAYVHFTNSLNEMAYTISYEERHIQLIFNTSKSHLYP